MKFLEGSKKILTAAGLGTGQFLQFFGKDISRGLMRFGITVVLVVFVILECDLCIKFIDINIVSAMWAFCLLIIFLSGLIIYINFIIKTKNIKELLDYLEDVISTRSQLSSKSAEMYKSKNTYCVQKILGMFAFGFNLNLAIHVIPAFLPLLHILFGHPSPELWLTLTPFSLHYAISFFERNLFYFEISLVIGYTMGTSYLTVLRAFSTIYICVSTNIEAFSDDVETNITRLNVIIDRKMSIKKELGQIIEFQLHCYRLMEMLENIIQMPIFCQITIFTLQLAIYLFEVEKSIAAISLNMLTFMGGLPFLTLIQYTLCYYVTTLTMNVMLFGDHIYLLQWYQLTQNEQFIVQTMIIRAQKAFELKGLGVFVCSLETFAAMSRNAVSYYMIFRQFGNGV